jgi:hypothetical protein
MADKYTHDELMSRLGSLGRKVATGDERMPVNGALMEMAERTHDRHKSGQPSGYIQELETAIEFDMLQIQTLWHLSGLPV